MMKKLGRHQLVFSLFHFLPFVFLASTGRDGGFGSGSGDMQSQPDTIFVQGLPTEVGEREIAAHFGAIGVIKVRLSYLFKAISLNCSLSVYFACAYL